MKKQSLLLITGSILAFASCNPDTGNNADEMQAKVDSIVNARVEQIRMELEAKNDEYIMEMAVYRADSIMAAMSGKKVTTTKPKSPAKEVILEEEAPVEETKKGGVSDRPGSTNNNKGNGGVSDRPGSTNNSGSGKVNDRPGSTNNK